MKVRNAVMVAAVLAAAGAAQAQVNGQYKPAYGAAVGVQTTGTAFGDSNLGQTISANGSELNGIYAYSDGTNLNVLLTGNLETNFNKLGVFIQTNAGGQNVLNSSSFQGLAGNYNGLTFDSAFSPNVWVSFTHGGGQIGSGYGMFVNAGTTNLPGYGGDFLGGNGANDGTGLSGGNNWLGVKVAVDNSNVFGVDTAGLGFGPEFVTTGVEFQIPLANLGISSIFGVKIAAMVNGQGNDFLSNQVLGGLPAGTGNLGNNGNGGLSNVNFNNFAGDQFVTLIPAPGTAALLGLGGLVAARRRRA